jgi:hypothetical protein
MTAASTPEADLEAAREAYVWGFPLVVMHRTRALHCSRTPTGVLNHVDGLATPAARTVVAPNNDTLYSSGWYDLSFGDVVVEVPPIERYWSVMVLDAYTNVQYISRRTHGTEGASVRLTLDPDAEPVRGRSDFLPVATPTAWILVRTLVDGPDDLDAARAIQRQIAVTAPPGHPHHTTTRAGRPDQVHTAGAAFFDELTAAVAVDPPARWHPRPSDAAWALIADPRRIDTESLAEAVERGDATVAANRAATDRRGNGWGTNQSGSDFGDDVLRRASIAKFALAAHHPAENRSYVAHTDDRGNRLDGDVPLTLRFAPDEPACDAFWSLTVYGRDLYLVDNAIGRYAIGDRTAGLRRDARGGLELTIGRSPPPDTSNWLPAPSGRYVLALRVYEGRPEVVDATWFPPALSSS